MIDNDSYDADTNGVGAPNNDEDGAPVSVPAILPVIPIEIDRTSDLKKAHDRLIQALNEDIRNRVPIDAAQFLPYNPIGGVYMPISDTEKEQAVQRIAEQAPGIITLLFKQNWITSLFGVVAIVPQLLVVAGVDLGLWSGVVSVVAGGFGLIFSKSATAKE
jgi:hypothetical protein